MFWSAVVPNPLAQMLAFINRKKKISSWRLRPCPRRGTVTSTSASSWPHAWGLVSHEHSVVPGPLYSRRAERQKSYAASFLLEQSSYHDSAFPFSMKGAQVCAPMKSSFNEAWSASPSIHRWNAWFCKSCTSVAKCSLMRHKWVCRGVY